MINKTPKGFTLVETLLAVLILTIAIAGPLTIAAKGLQLSLNARDQVIAGGLAQDALEYVHFIRDTNRLNNQDWLAGLNGVSNNHTTNQTGGQANCTGGNYCIIDSLADQVTYCGTSLSACASTYLYFNPGSTGGNYTYQTAGNTKTIYSRTISITTPSAGGNASEANIRVVVQWLDAGGTTRSVELRDSLFNWQ